MNTRAPTTGALLTIVIFALSCFGGGVYVWKRFGGDLPLEAKGYRFQVAFPQGGNIQRNTDVRISGVSVGKVVSVKPVGQRTDALIELDRRFAPLRANAHVLLRVKTLLGEPFVALTPGTRTAGWVKDGGRLADGQVQDNQQLDQVLASFDKKARESLKKLTLSLSAAFEGRDDELNAAIGSGAGAADALDQLATELDGQRPELTSLIRNAGAALDALGRRSTSVQHVIRSGNEVFSETAARDRQLTATLNALPGFLAALNRSSLKLSPVLDDAAPTMRALRPAARDLGPGLKRLNGLLPSATRILKQLPPVLKDAKRVLPQAVKLTDAAGRSAKPLDLAGRQLVPALKFVESYKDDIVQATGKLAASTAGYTVQPNGEKLHYLRTLFVLTNELVLGAKQRPPSNRHAAYPAPGEAARLGWGQRSSDCRVTSNPSTIPVLGMGVPPCIQSPGWNFGGVNRQFPHVEADPPLGTKK